MVIILANLIPGTLQRTCPYRADYRIKQVHAVHDQRQRYWLNIISVSHFIICLFGFLLSIQKRCKWGLKGIHTKDRNTSNQSNPSSTHTVQHPKTFYLHEPICKMFSNTLCITQHKTMITLHFFHLLYTAQTWILCFIVCHSYDIQRAKLTLHLNYPSVVFVLHQQN